MKVSFKEVEMKDHIHIFGASGSGASTLGKALAKHLPHTNFDGDDYFWIEKFSKQRERSERIELLAEDLAKHKQWILSGAICGWGDVLKSDFDLVIFLYVPPEIRLQRLEQREIERYGDEILPSGSMHEESKQFLDWASKYDNGGIEIRSKILHEHWMKDLSCTVLRIEGCQTVDERINIILDFLEKNE